LLQVTDAIEQTGNCKQYPTNIQVTDAIEQTGNCKQYPTNTRTQMYQNSFLPATIRIWNDLPLSVRRLPSLKSFKQSLNSNKSKLKSIFSFGSRRAQILHTRLRL